MSDYILSVRNFKTAAPDSAFGNEVAPASYLEVADGQTIYGRADIIADRRQWLANLLAEHGKPLTDILFFVHGFNMSCADVLQRHREIKAGLKDYGWQGALVSFDWPSDSNVLMYLPDRHNAKASCMELVNSGISFLAEQAQDPNCVINAHVLAHSTGAYIIREAFTDADTTMFTVNNPGRYRSWYL